VAPVEPPWHDCVRRADQKFRRAFASAVLCGASMEVVGGQIDLATP
jgi:hypothetical protein